MTTTDNDLLEEKFRARDLALSVAVGALDKRLDGMNEFREALQDQTRTFATRDVLDTMTLALNQLRIDMSRYSTRMEELDKAAALDRAQLDRRLELMNEFRSQLKDQAAGFYTRGEQKAFETDVQARLATNWPLLVSFVSVLLVVLAGGWGIMGLKIDSASGPLVVGVEQLKTSATNLLGRLGVVEGTVNQHSTSMSELGLLKQNYLMVADRLATIRADVAKQAAALVEIETQFCASDVTRNLMHATDMRIQSVMWSKVMDTHMPTDNAYYPVICRKNAD